MKASLLFASIFLLTSALASRPARAQSGPPAVVVSATGYQNAVRLDVGGIIGRNIGLAITRREGYLQLPLLFGYERQLGRRTSINTELLLNGGSSEAKTAGAALQGRYYFRQSQRPGLAGFYAAPTLSLRRVTEPVYYGPQRERQLLGGGGALLGAQIPLGKPGRLLLDASLGVMSWTRLDDRADEYAYRSYYEIHGTVADGRLSLGYRF